MKTSNYTPFFRQMGLIAIVALGLVAGPQKGHAQCFSGWQYSQKVYINNANAADLDSFQVPLYVNTAALVTATHMNADGSDIRFITSPGCCISLPYHIDSGMNSTMTKIWVKVPYIPANGNDTIIMLYGNAAATAASDPVATYDMWEPFDNQANHFTNACDDGTGAMSVSGGLATFSWNNDAVWQSDNTFGLNHVYTADGMATAVSGAFPGLYWNAADASAGYGLVFTDFTGNGGSVSTGHSQDVGEGFCNPIGGSNLPISSSSDGTGLWSFTWVGYGNQVASYRDLGTFSVNDYEYDKNQPLKLCLGGIDGSQGSYTLDWVRVRKYAAVIPTSTYGTEAAYATTTISYTTPACKATGATSTPAVAGTANGTYSVAPAGATINATTGVIDLGASAAGTYTVTYTAQSADTCNVTATATIVINAAATVPTVTANGGILSVTGTYTSYQWYRNGTLVAGATTNPYTATQSGTYHVIATDANGCTAQSADMPVVVTGINNVAAGIDNLSVYPNPSNGLFTIDGTAKADDNKATIEVTDITGKVLMITDTKIVNNAIHQEIQLNGKIPAGVYMLRITAGSEKKTVRLNVQ